MVQKFIFQKFLDKANLIHNYKYDYSKSIYINNKTKLIIICPLHGEFTQLPNNHLKTQGCIKCSFQKRSFNTEKFIIKCQKIWNGFYDYSLVNYSNNHTKIKIICPKHGIFEQNPVDHYTHGCNQCAMELRHKNISLTLQDFITLSRQIHQDKYDYSKSIYINNKTKIEIICQIHGSFWQKPSYHLQGCNCPKCANSGISKAETKWLNQHNISQNFRQFYIKIDNKNIKVDGYDPITNTVYEYNGDFWHGNPLIYNSNDINDVNKKTFGELYIETINRENLIKSAGYNLVVKWETEFI